MYTPAQLKEMIRMAHALGFDDDVERYKAELARLEASTR